MCSTAALINPYTSEVSVNWMNPRQSDTVSQPGQSKKSEHGICVPIKSLRTHG